MNIVDPVVRLEQQLAGLLLGTAVGDALGLPAENLSPERIRRRWPGPLRMRLLFGRGMISDDGEHSLMVAQALLSHPADPAAFQRALAWKFRWWFAGLPGGVGFLRRGGSRPNLMVANPNPAAGLLFSQLRSKAAIILAVVAGGIQDEILLTSLAHET